ncbi:hypothetical protein GCM10020219_058160 [Nonomuraea dietziae]
MDELGTDEEAPVDIETEIAGHPGAGAVRADDEPGLHRFRTREPYTAHRRVDVPYAQEDLRPGRLRRVACVLVHGRHVGHAVLVPVAGEPDRRPPRRRIQQHVPHTRPEQMVGQVEVVQGATHEDPGGADARRQRPAAVDHHHFQVPSREQVGCAQTGQSRPHDQYIHCLHILRR